MGSLIEINDTLKISKERGFPKELVYEKFIESPEEFASFVGQEFEFWNNDERLYNRPPTRVHLVEEMADGKWLYWGHVMVVEQTISNGKTFGKFRIRKLMKSRLSGKVILAGSPEGVFLSSFVNGLIL